MNHKKLSLRVIETGAEYQTPIAQLKQLCYLGPLTQWFIDHNVPKAGAHASKYIKRFINAGNVPKMKYLCIACSGTGLSTNDNHDVCFICKGTGLFEQR